MGYVSSIAGGGIGINRTSIGARLHIQHDGSGALRHMIKLANNGAGQGTGAQINMGASTADENYSASIAGFFDNPGTSFIIKTAGTYGNQSTVAERLRVQHDGNVGINSTSPKAKLDVIGDTKLQGNLNVTGITTFNHAANALHPLKIVSGNGTGGISTYLFTTGAGVHDIRFEQRYNGNWNINNNEHMRLVWSAPNENAFSSTNGDVFSIQPNTTTGGGFSRVSFKVTDTSSGLVDSYRMAYDYHRFNIKGVTALNIGYTGIGITERLFHWGDTDTYLKFGSNTLSFHAGSDTDRRFLVGQTLVRFENLSNGVDINSDLDVDGHTELDNVNVSGITTFPNAGKVLIGTATQGHTGADDLTIATTGTTGITIRSGDTSNGNIYFSDATSGDGEYKGYVSYNHSDDSLKLGTAAGNRIIISAAGYVKIGTNVEGYAGAPNLTVASTGNCGITIRSGASNQGTIAFSDAESGAGEYDGFLQYSQANRELKVGTASAVRFTVTSGGHVVPYVDSTYNLGTSSKRWKNLYVDNILSGVTTTGTLNTGDTTFTGSVSAGSTTGVDGYYLKSTGIGVTWAVLPSSRTGLTTSATAGQTSFNFSYNVGFVDVFLNGVKLPSTEFTASNGSTIVLDDAAFANDTLEFISLNTVPVTSSGGAQNLTGLADVTISGTPVAGDTLQHNGSVFVNDYTVTSTKTSTSQASIHSLAVATYRSVEYTIQITEGTKYHVTKILAIHDGTNVTFNEYGTLTTHSSLATFALDVNSGNMRLLATPASSNSTVFKVKFNAIKV